MKGNCISRNVVRLFVPPFSLTRKGESERTNCNIQFNHCLFYFSSEQKRRLKAEQKAKEKAEKAEKAPPVTDGPKKNKDALKEEEITPNEYFKLRSSAVQQLKTSNITPYPHKYHVSISLQEYIEKFTYLTSGQALEDQSFSVAG